MRASLTALLAFTCAVAAAAQDATTARERAAIDAVCQLGGKTDVDARLAPEARVVAKFENATDATLAGLKAIPQLGAVEIFDTTKCKDKSFATLKSLPHLRRLVVEKADLTPAAVSAVGECRELRHLTLVNCGLSDSEVAGLKPLARLEHLALSDNPRVTDKAIAVVKGFDRLQVLYLSKTAITDRGLAELKVLDGLRTLSVRGTKVTLDAAEKFPDDMPNLRKVQW